MPTLQEQVTTAVTDINAARDDIEADAATLHSIVHGPASGTGSTVTTDAGPVSTAARAVAEITVSAWQVWLWSASTSGDPGTGKVLVNNATVASATALHISKTNAGGASVAAWIATWDDRGATVKGRVRLFSHSDSAKWVEVDVVSISDQTTYYAVTISGPVSGTAPAANDRLGVVFIPIGDQGAVGTAAGLDYAFNTATSGDPGSGKLRLDNATASLATILAISKTGRNSESLGTVIGTWDDSTSSVKGHLRVYQANDRSRWIEAAVTSIDDQSTYWGLNIASVSAGTGISNNAVVVVEFRAKGDAGSAGANGSNDLLAPSIAAGVAQAMDAIYSSGYRMSDLAYSSTFAGFATAAPYVADFDIVDVYLKFETLPCTARVFVADTTGLVLADGSRTISANGWHTFVMSRRLVAADFASGVLYVHVHASTPNTSRYARAYTLTNPRRPDATTYPDRYTLTSQTSNVAVGASITTSNWPLNTAGSTINALPFRLIDSRAMRAAGHVRRPEMSYSVDYATITDVAVLKAPLANPRGSSFSAWGVLLAKASYPGSFNGVRLPSIKRSTVTTDAERWSRITVEVRDVGTGGAIVAIGDADVDMDSDVLINLVIALRSPTTGAVLTVDPTTLTGPNFFISFAAWNEIGEPAWIGECTAASVPNAVSYHYLSAGYPLWSTTATVHGVDTVMLGSPVLIAQPRPQKRAEPSRLAGRVEALEQGGIEEVALCPQQWFLDGDQANIYWEGLVPHVSGDTAFSVTCTKGKTFVECWRHTVVTGDVGTATLTLQPVNKRNGRARGKPKSTTLNFISATAGSGGTARNLLMIGDSRTADGIVARELAHLLGADANCPVTLVGSQNPNNTVLGATAWASTTAYTAGTSVVTNGGNTYVCTSSHTSGGSFDGTKFAIIKHEARSGWAASTFALTGSPFFVSGALNIASYATTNSISAIDRLIINLGVNDVFNATTDSGCVGVGSSTGTMFFNIESLITAFKTYNPSIKIGIALTEPPSTSQDGFGDAYGNATPQWRIKRNLWWLYLLGVRQFGGRTSEGIDLLPYHTSIDCERDFPVGVASVASAFSTVNVSRVIDAVHPAESGKKKLSRVARAWLKAKG